MDMVERRRSIPSLSIIAYRFILATIVICSLAVQISSRASVVSLYETVDRIVSMDATTVATAVTRSDDNDEMTRFSSSLDDDGLEIHQFTASVDTNSKGQSSGHNMIESRANRHDGAFQKEQMKQFRDRRRSRFNTMDPSTKSMLRRWTSNGTDIRQGGTRLPLDHLGFLRKWQVASTDTCLKDDSNNKVPSWHRRAPAFILLGHHKCGTQALTQYLWQHPQIVTSGRIEMGFFHNQGLKFTSSQGIQQQRGRERYMHTFKSEIPSEVVDEFMSDDSNLIMFENHPRYFLDSDRTAGFVTCMVPWVKLVVIFRDPIERIVSHYNYANEARTRTGSASLPSYQTWIQHDLASLQAAGVVAANRTKEELESFSGSEAEKEAWRRYTTSRNSQFLVGRGLYSIQLRQWYSAFDRIGKSRSDLLVLRSEDIKNNTQREYSKILNFLDLPEHTLSDSGAKHTTSKEQFLSMPEKDRRELELFYAPYNRQLSRLLGKPWDRVWGY